MTSLNYILLIGVVVAASGCISIDNDDEESRQAPLSGQVTEIVDGDTVRIQSEGNTYDIRLLGIDTPETFGEVNPEEFNSTNQTCVEEVGRKAKDYTAENLLNKEVQLVYDREAGKQGGFDRYLAEIYVDMNGTTPVLYKHRENNFNMQLLSEGYARFYEPEDYETRRHAYYTAAEETSKIFPEGNIWGCN